MASRMIDAPVARASATRPPGWHATRPRQAWLETALVAPRSGAVRKLVRRLGMNAAERAADIAAAPDRSVLCNGIIPEVAQRGGNILFVGVRAYTTDYYAQLESGGGTCWTLDIDPAAAAFGAAGRHATGCIGALADLIPGVAFDSIVMTGVLGFGVNRFSHQRAVMAECAEALVEGGVLVLGWNGSRVHPSLLEEAAANWFDYRPLGELPPRIWVRDYDHNFAFLRRR
jgi:hypothetical protein